MLISIFTATMNRGYIIDRLYKSLCSQILKNFEWIVIDDGSNDDTEKLFETYSYNDMFPVIYIKKNIRGGKYRAMTQGLEYAQGELFFIVDSDDYLMKDSTQYIEKLWKKESNQSNLGICLRRIDPKTCTIIGKSFPSNGMYLTPSEINFVYKINCDKAEIFRTELLKKMFFPEFEKETFLTEAYWVYLLEKETSLKFACYNKGVRFTEYLPDGLTKNKNQLRYENPKGYVAYYKLALTLPHFYRNPMAVMSAIFHLIILTFIKRG